MENFMAYRKLYDEKGMLEEREVYRNGDLVEK